MVKRSSLSTLSKFSTTHNPLVTTVESLGVSSSVDKMATEVEQDELLNYVAITAHSNDDLNEGGESSSYGDEPSDSDDWPNEDGFLPACPITIPSNSDTDSQSSSSGLTMRDSLLAEAWNRKKELAIQDELANLKEHTMPHLLGRSSSDCGATAAMRRYHLLNRCASDVGEKSSSAPERMRTRSLTDDDFEELKGCIDLGFRFDETSLPALSHTLPALEVYCAVAQSLHESPYCPNSPAASPAMLCSSAPSTPQWRVCSPGDSSDDVKGRLRHWAQAVACNVRLCH